MAFLIHSTVQILENVEIDADREAGQKYFEGSVKFMKTLNEVLDLLIVTVSCFFIQITAIFIKTLYSI